VGKRIGQLATGTRNELGAPLPLAPATMSTPEPARLAVVEGRPPARADGFLVITGALPTPDRDSGSLRLNSILASLCDAGHTVTIISTRQDPQQPYAAHLQALGLTVVRGESAGVQHLSQHGHTFRTVLISRPDTALEWLFPVRVFAPRARAVYDTVDLHSVRLSRAANLLDDPVLHERAERYRRIEAFAVNAADLVLTVTDTERTTLLNLRPTLAVEVVPNIHIVEPLHAKWGDRSGLVFIGSFLHEPNLDAIRHFVADVLPIIRRRLPDITFTIIGSDMPDEIRALASKTIRPVGYVADPRPAFESALMLVAPLRYGAGMKGKIGHAMSHGLPVVTTSIGAEGMGLIDGETALIADGTDAFAAAVVRLHTDRLLWEHLAARGLAYLQATFSTHAAAERLISLFPRPAEASDTE
jgi:glycosyltransferase involved in cell wall biosynthesis